MARLKKDKKKKKDRKKELLIAKVNKLKQTYPGMLTGGKMTDTLRKLGIDPKKLVDEEYSWKK